MKKRFVKSVLSVLVASMLVFSACGDSSSNQSGEPKTNTETNIQEDNNNSENTEKSDTSDNVVEDNNEDIENNSEEENTTSEENDQNNNDDTSDGNTFSDNDNNNNQENNNQQNENNAASVAKTESGTPVANHGRLSVKGTRLVDKNGNPYQIQGVSTHGIGWFPEYVNKDAFKTMRDEWGINCVRLAMYTAEGAGYCTGGNREQLKKLVNDGVSYATELGLYVIIDWHILQDLDPNKYKEDAKAFFDEMSKKYANNDNVIYEICNEPNGGTSWSQVKSYALEIIPVIKANDPNAIIIVGTPTWSQDVDIAANDPITGYTNIMYTIHFYAETHRESLRNKMVTAINKGLPIFCTEFGICDASGNGTINEAEANKWIAEMQKYGVGYCIWNLSNKNESSSLIASGCNKKSGWTENDLSQEGKWYVGILGGKALGTTESTDNNSNNNSDNNNNNNSNNNNSSVDAVKASKDNTEVSIANTGNWNDGKNDCYQFTVTIKNTGSAPIKDWKVGVTFGSNITLDQSWSGTFNISGKTVNITSCEYNGEIAAGTSIEVGFIVCTSGSVGTPTISIY